MASLPPVSPLLHMGFLSNAAFTISSSGFLSHLSIKRSNFHKARWCCVSFVDQPLDRQFTTIAWRYHKDEACAGMWLLIIYVNFSLTLLQMNNLFWQWLSMKAGLNCCFFGVDEWRDFRSSSNESLVRNNQREQSRQLCLKKSISSTNNWFLVSNCCLGISCRSSPQIRWYLHRLR